ncbi:hypothetical protein CkaCkLH20_01306 [Colletotrichum karsti]|uniref:L-glutamate gamma-semialdehyde dehydrogenase n=1 Tax=Colletotrichum karsti TaxID=1095194 RepID=A0A9P6IFS8_9PEZI|nr:uncharacterized protein CkaCkLH20_01306 [Colletotrichum karsti]KAF9881156.1 hypothetical protein CkaCkLH20_01306 [Colletotrichum karsti]
MLSPALATLRFLNNSPPFWVFDVQRNPLLHGLMKRTMYNHFCAGENQAEVTSTISEIKRMGFRGAILTYAREIVVDNRTEEEVGRGMKEESTASETEKDSGIDAWREGVLTTVEMLGEGDILALKLTGAGPAVSETLSSGRPLPKQMKEALAEVCSRAVERKARIFVDAEQVKVQPGIDTVALDLMRQFNTNGKGAVVYNTYQAYLKSTPDTLYEHMKVAKNDDFVLGVKLVRGAYISSEPRHLINDTKEDTDDSYDSVAKGLLSQSYRDFGAAGGETFPQLELFLATHNKHSVLAANELQQSRVKSGQPLTKIQYGQLLGMADEVSFSLLQQADVELKEKGAKGMAPVEVYKCLSWGSLGDCLSYLLRRAVENRDAVSRTKSEFEALKTEVNTAIERALEAKSTWENKSFTDRAAVFLRAAELIAGKYRHDIMAATMLGQGKNIWQAEIDSAAESCDFLRFNVHYASELYKQQNTMNDAGVWNRTEYRPLEGFVYAISPFNFTAIGANLTVAPAIMGNVVLWKPSDYALYSSHLLLKIFQEAGLPPNVIQLIPGEPEAITSTILQHPKFAALHFTGSTDVFRQLYGKIGAGVAEGRYESYPRVVGETGGKNFHLVHGSADVRNAVVNTIRGAFEYQGQKCSATSRLYVAESVWPEFKEMLLKETSQLKVGSPEEADNFIGPVIHERSWKKLEAVIDQAKNDPEVELLAGGVADKSKGWFVSPTIFQTSNAANDLMKTEFFGPILTAYVYPDEKYEELLPVINSTTQFGLTGAVFARDREAIEAAEKGLRHSAGNFYINSKSSGAVVGHQPFGGGRASGTNDKATSTNLLARFTSIRSLKEDFVGADTVLYPSNEV